MKIEIALLISIISVVFGISQTVSNFKRNSKIDNKSEASELTTVIVKLENIGKDISEMKSDLRDIKCDIKEHSERIIKLEQQVKVLNKKVFETKEGNL